MFPACGVSYSAEGLTDCGLKTGPSKKYPSRFTRNGYKIATKFNTGINYLVEVYQLLDSGAAGSYPVLPQAFCP